MHVYLNEPEVRTGLALGRGQFRARLDFLDTAWRPNTGLRMNAALALISGPSDVRYVEDAQTGEIRVDVHRPIK
jgi:hypothetical protein